MNINNPDKYSRQRITFVRFIFQNLSFITLALKREKKLCGSNKKNQPVNEKLFI